MRHDRRAAYDHKSLVVRTKGFWVTRDINGQIGGFFLLENSALSFAGRNGLSAGCATIFLSERTELDLENNGNPLVAQFGWPKRLAMQGRRRMVASINNMTQAVKRRLKDIHLFWIQATAETATTGTTLHAANNSG
jgi:hypothetical protein